MAERPSENIINGKTKHVANEKYGDERSSRSVSDMKKITEGDSSGFSTETEQIKTQIEETRGNMGETIDAIQDRLSFSNISEQVSEQVNNAIETAKDSVYDATVGKVVNFMKNAGNDISGTRVMQTIKENPIPFALIGLGSGLLVYNSFGKKNYRSRANYSSSKRSINDAGGSDRSYNKKLYGVAEKVSDAVGTAFDGISSAAGTTYTGARDIAARAYEKAGEIGTVAHEKYDHFIEEKPLAVGAVALALGAAVGFAIPSTQYEGELMGEARDSLLTKAEETTADLVDKAKQLAGKAGNAVKEEVNSAIESASERRIA